MARTPPVLLLLALPTLPTLSACMNEYHPEYHPETVYQYVQTVKVEDPRPPPAPVVVIVQSQPSSASPPPEAAPSASPRAPARARASPRRAALAADAGAPSFQAAPVFAADDRP
jgi:hypothetical protein